MTNELEQLKKLRRMSVFGLPENQQHAALLDSAIKTIESQAATIAELRRNQEAAIAGYKEQLRATTAERDELRLLKFARFNNEDCWLYQGDDNDHLESLVCPVVISAPKLIEILERNTTPTPAADEARTKPKCIKCDGTGEIAQYPDEIDCNACDGTGLSDSRDRKPAVSDATFDGLLLAYFDAASSYGASIGTPNSSAAKADLKLADKALCQHVQILEKRAWCWGESEKELAKIAELVGGKRGAVLQDVALALQSLRAEPDIDAIMIEAGNVAHEQGGTEEGEYLLTHDGLEVVVKAVLNIAGPQSPRAQQAEVSQELASKWESEALNARGFTTPQYVAAKAIAWHLGQCSSELPPLPLTKGYEPNCPHAPWVNALLSDYGMQCYNAGKRLIPASALTREAVEPVFYANPNSLAIFRSGEGPGFMMTVLRNPAPESIALYASSITPAAVGMPLTDVALSQMWDETDGWIDFARAIERKHGIGLSAAPVEPVAKAKCICGLHDSTACASYMGGDDDRCKRRNALGDVCVHSRACHPATGEDTP